MKGIKSICPKCNQVGTQTIFTNGVAKYLKFSHGSKNVCYIGRIRSQGEGMGMLNKPQSFEDFEKALKDISKQLRKLSEYYSHSKSGSSVKLARSIDDILLKYGY
ncbi:MAG TPA: hypothetical protein VIH27_03720 [Nitrososphaerales archaeon]